LDQYKIYNHCQGLVVNNPKASKIQRYQKSNGIKNSPSRQISWAVLDYSKTKTIVPQLVINDKEYLSRAIIIADPGFSTFNPFTWTNIKFIIIAKV
jgi:hypothetical protein